MFGKAGQAKPVAKRNKFSNISINDTGIFYLLLFTFIFKLAKQMD